MACFIDAEALLCWQFVIIWPAALEMVPSFFRIWWDKAFIGDRGNPMGDGEALCSLRSQQAMWRMFKDFLGQPDGILYSPWKEQRKLLHIGAEFCLKSDLDFYPCVISLFHEEFLVFNLKFFKKIIKPHKDKNLNVIWKKNLPQCILLCVPLLQGYST